MVVSGGSLSLGGLNKDTRKGQLYSKELFGRFEDTKKSFQN